MPIQQSPPRLGHLENLEDQLSTEGSSDYNSTRQGGLSGSRSCRLDHVRLLPRDDTHLLLLPTLWRVSLLAVNR